ncbi:carcinoembryonic antigen-related cell adhesion molecule 4-like [Petaurus breviceps papuanus]|uniref:carcinoembryonic antigen-related cell adhesion molecule 4-like n=1 Tax=Petaurus breviceps papuanus TaxID=3040969 RepID=UPI0036DF7547
MESPSEGLYSGGSPWKGLLITAAVLSTWIQSASTQSPKMRVKLSPLYGTVGGNITLSIVGLSKESGRYTWFRKTTDESNRIAAYDDQTRQQTPVSGRETVFPNGSLLITNLTLSDSDEYIVEIFSIVDVPGNYQLSFLKAHLEVYDSNSRGGAIAGIVIGILIGVALIGALIYFLFFRKTGGASQGMLGDPGPGGKTHPTQKPSQVLENIYSLQDSSRSAQGLSPTPTSSAAAPENVYQALDASGVAVYDSFDVTSKPQTKEGGRSP